MKSVDKKAFTLVEVMIIVSILGILAAIVLPEFQGHIRQAKEAAAKDNLRILRTAIQRYAADHNGIPPGYLNDDTSMAPTILVANNQLKTLLNTIPENPLNNLSDIMVLRDEAIFPTNADGNSGWIYQPASKIIKLNYPGTDSTGVNYFEY